MSDPLFEMNRTLGELLADVKNIKADQEEDRKTNAGFRREVRDEIGGIKESVARIDLAITPIAAKVENHDEVIEEHGTKLAAFKIFQDRIGAVTGIASVALTTAIGGVWYLITAYWTDLIAFIGRLWPK